MDVSIAVSLIRGQMGTVVERAVNVAVETVLAEMLKVVGAKFEELKSQVVLMKRDLVTLQREKALKEKENDNIRAKLRYTELKLKYYRQGVEEELQQRASSSTLVRIHPPNFSRSQRAEAGASPTKRSPSCSAQRTAGGAPTRSSQVPECTSSQSVSGPAVRVRCPSDVADSELSDLVLPVTLAVKKPAECQDSTVPLCQTERDASHRKDVDREDKCEWTTAVRPSTDGMSAGVAPHPTGLTLDAGHQPAAASRSPDVSAQPDSSNPPPSALEVKVEVLQPQEEEEEVICIKEEPEEEQEVMATLLLDCRVQQSRLPEAEPQRLVTEWSRPLGSQINPNAAFSSAGPSTYALPQLASFLPSTAANPPGVSPRQAARPWTKDLSIYEEFKLRRNELRRRNLNRRRELEKSLPQPLLADLVRERREKTRLRVARWRAKRKLQACLNQAQAHGGVAGLSQAGFPASSQPQQLRVPCASSNQHGQNLVASQSSTFLSNMSAMLPLMPSSSSSSSVLLLAPNRAPHEHAVTSSSSSYPQVSLSQQGITLTDPDTLQ